MLIGAVPKGPNLTYVVNIDMAGTKTRFDRYDETN